MMAGFLQILASQLAKISVQPSEVNDRARTKTPPANNSSDNGSLEMVADVVGNRRVKPRMKLVTVHLTLGFDAPLRLASRGLGVVDTWLRAMSPL